MFKIITILQSIFLLFATTPTPINSNQNKIAQTNKYTTSHEYDFSNDAPFRLEHINIKTTIKKIFITIYYYLNTARQTTMTLDVNGIIKTRNFSKTTSTRKSNKWTLELTNSSYNTKLNIRYFVSWGQRYQLDGIIYFDDDTTEDNFLLSKGKYKYKIISAVNFNNSLGEFTYEYDDINLEVFLNKKNKYFNTPIIATVKNSNLSHYEFEILDHNNISIHKTENKEMKTIDKLVVPGNYTLVLKLYYQKGAINKVITLNFLYSIDKYLIGLCTTAIYCLEKGENNDGEIELIKKENFII